MRRKHLFIPFYLCLLLAPACQKNARQDIPFPVFGSWRDGLGAANGKPILMIFDWHGSSADAFSILLEPTVLPLAQQYNVVWVAVDDGTPLPPDTTILDRNGRRLKTLGGFYADLQRRSLPEHYRPMYALFSPDGKPILLNNKPLYCGYASPKDEEGVRGFVWMLEAGLRK